MRMEAETTLINALCNNDTNGSICIDNVLNSIGTVSYQWDAAAMKATNAPGADQFIKREYRKGWNLA